MQRKKTHLKQILSNPKKFVMGSAINTDGFRKDEGFAKAMFIQVLQKRLHGWSEEAATPKTVTRAPSTDVQHAWSRSIGEASEGIRCEEEHEKRNHSQASHVSRGITNHAAQWVREDMLSLHGFSCTATTLFSRLRLPEDYFDLRYVIGIFISCRAFREYQVLVLLWGCGEALCFGLSV